MPGVRQGRGCRGREVSLQRRRELVRLSKPELIDRIVELETATERYLMDDENVRKAHSADLGLDQ